MGTERERVNEKKKKTSEIDFFLDFVCVCWNCIFQFQDFRSLSEKVKGSY